MRIMAASKMGVATLLAFALTACGLSPDTAPKTTNKLDESTPRGAVTQFYTRNVVYRVDPDVVVTMPDLVADVIVKKPNEPFVPANADDYVLQIHTGNMVMDDAAMSAIFNKFVFNGPDSPLSDLKVTNTPGLVTLKGTLHKGIPIPFSMEGTLVPDGAGALRMKPTAVYGAGIRVDGIMNLIGLETASMINSKSPGVKIDGNDVIICPNKLLPPPAVNGYVVGAKVEQGKVTMIYDDRVRRVMPTPPEPAAKNFIYMVGGTALINNHLILDMNMQEIDDTPADPMYFYMVVYREQLEAGFVVADHGATIAYLPDVKGTTVGKSRFRPVL